MSAQQKKRVIVVGAGISGLSCAYRLLQEGFNVTVIDIARRVGGVMQSSMNDEGFLCEAGPNSFPNDPDIMRLIEEVALLDELVTTNAGLPRYVYYRRKLTAVPTGLGGVLRTPLLSAGSKWRVLREYWGKSAPAGREESLADFIKRRFGPEVLRNVAAPLASGIYAGDVNRLSAQSAFPRLLQYERERGSVTKGLVKAAKEAAEQKKKRLLCSFKRGLHTFPWRLAERIGKENVELGTQIKSIHVMLRETINTFYLRLKTDEGERDVFADALVFAATAYRTAELVRSVSPKLAEELTGIDYPPMTAMCLGYKRLDLGHPLNGFGFVVPGGESVRMLGCIWNSTLFPGRAPSDSVLLTVFLGGATDFDVVAMGDDKLLNIVKKDLRQTLGIIIAPEVLAINRYERSIPQFTMGHEIRLKRIEAELKKVPGFFLTGNFFHGISAGDCVKQSNETASAVKNYLSC